MTTPLRIAPWGSRANRYSDTLSANADKLPSEYAEHMDLLRKYFGPTGPRTPFSSMTDEEQRTLLDMLQRRIASLKETVNALLQTSTISLKNVSYTDKVSGLTGLVEQVKRREGGTGAAAIVPVAAAAKPALHTDSLFRAACFLLRYSTSGDKLSIPELQADWNAFSAAAKAVTLEQFLTTLHDTTPSTPLSDLSKLYTITEIQRATCTAPDPVRARKQLAPLLRGFLRGLEGGDKGKVAALRTLLEPQPSIPFEELVAYADALLTDPAAPAPASFPKTKLPDHPLLVQYVNWLLLTLV